MICLSEIQEFPHPYKLTTEQYRDLQERIINDPDLKMTGPIHIFAWISVEGITEAAIASMWKDWEGPSLTFNPHDRPSEVEPYKQRILDLYNIVTSE